MTLARSSHGTLVAVEFTPGGAMTNIAELGDVNLPELMRNEFDATTQEKDIDAYVLGVLRRSPLTLPINFLPGNATHNHTAGLQKLLLDNTYTGFRVTVPAIASGDPGVVWVASGQVQKIAGKAPVDGKLSADITIRFSGAMSIGGVVVGA